MSLYRGALASGPRAAPHILELVALIFIVSVSRYVCVHISSCLCVHAVCVCVLHTHGDLIKYGLNCTCSSSQLSVVQLFPVGGERVVLADSQPGCENARSHFLIRLCSHCRAFPVFPGR